MRNILLVSLVTLLAPFAFAEKLFFEQCLITKQGGRSLNNCFSSSLSKILVRASGHPDIIKSDSIKSALQKSDQYVHTYKTHHEGKNELINISFKEQTIRSLISETPYTLWASSRPSTMFWVFLNSTNQLITQQKPYADTLLKQAKSRGIEIMLPLDDLETEQIIRTINSKKIGAVLWRASQRYQVDNAVIAIINQNNTDYKSQWTLINNTRQLNWEQPSHNINSLLEKSIDHLTDQYATESSQPKPVLNLSKPFFLEVSNIQSYLNLTQALHHIRSITNISKLNLLQAQQDHILLSVTGSSSHDELEENISRLHALTPAVNSARFKEATAHLKLVQNED